jgi:hypothetical protein
MGGAQKTLGLTPWWGLLEAWAAVGRSGRGLGGTISQMRIIIEKMWRWEHWRARGGMACVCRRLAAHRQGVRHQQCLHVAVSHGLAVGSRDA